MGILILCRSLAIGGAERQIVELAKGLHARGQRVAVAMFYGNGPLMAELQEVGIPTFDLKKSGRWDAIGFFVRLVRLVSNWKPSVIYSFLGVPNIVAVSMKHLFPDVLTVLGVRASNMDLDQYDWLLKVSYFLEGKLSRFADLIICNSSAGYRYASTQGFPKNKMVVIPNGIDTQYFQFDLEGRRRVRSAWGLPDDGILIGLVARLDPMKDHATFLEAARCAIRERHNLHFVCVGSGPIDYARGLRERAAALGLNDRLIWAGAQDEMPAVYSALDISSSSSSFGEGFSNAIAEAMACGVPCVVTDVGDSAYIVSETGIVVSPANPQALCEGLLRMVDKLGPDARGAARAAICNRFTDDELVARTLEALGGGTLR